MHLENGEIGVKWKRKNLKTETFEIKIFGQKQRKLA